MGGLTRAENIIKMTVIVKMNKSDKEISPERKLVFKMEEERLSDNQNNGK